MELAHAGYPDAKGGLISAAVLTEGTRRGLFCQESRGDYNRFQGRHCPRPHRQRRGGAALGIRRAFSS